MRTILASFTVVLLLITVCASATDESRGYARAELIVKYREPIAEAAWNESQHQAGFGTSSATAHLEQIHKRHRVRGMRRVVEELHRAGDRVLTRDHLLGHLRRRASKARAFDEAAIPNLHNLYRVQFEDENVDVEALARELSADPQVEYAHPNYFVYLAALPNDPQYSSQWHLPKISVPAAWDATTGDPGTVVAVIDTGVDWDHPDIAANIWQNAAETAANDVDDDQNGFIDDVRGWDFVDVENAYSFDPGEDIGPPDNDPSDFLGHGTLVAGAIGAVSNNGLGVAGVCWRCKIMPLRVGVTQRELDVIGGRAYILESWVVGALYYAARNGADVINMSLATWHWPGQMKDAIDYADAQGIVVVAAAGNSGLDGAAYPAAYEKVLSVGATDQNDQRSIWGVPQPPLYQGSASNFGSTVRLTAPGTQISSLYVNGAYGSANGTSIATAIASGAAALLRSHRPSFSNASVMKVLRSTADRISTDQYFAGGRVNLSRALSMTSVPTAEILTPLPDQTVGGASLAVTGSAAGPAFSSYTLEYGQGVSPSFWTTIRTASTAVSSGALGTWNLDAVADNFPYVLRLRVSDSAGNTAVDERLVYVQRSLVQGWPRNLGGAVTGDGVAIANVDLSDPQLEAAVTTVRTVSSQQRVDLHLLNHDGSYLPGWPIQAINEFLSPPTLADLTGEGEPEVVVGGYTWGFPNRTLSFHAYNKSGQEIPGWPKIVTSAQGYAFHSAAVADLDRDGLNEAVFSTRFSDKIGPIKDHVMYILRFDGSSLTGWPKATLLNYTSDTPSNLDDGSHVVVVDLDGDRDLEILVGIGMVPVAQLFAFHHTGAVVTGFPVNLPNRDIPNIVAGDIDNDGQVEIVASTIGGWLSAFERSGSIMSGWPRTMAFGGPPPILSDLDADRDLEILFPTNGDNITAFHHTGVAVANFPISIPSTRIGGGFSMAVTADMTGDGLPEIIQPSGDDPVIYAFHPSTAAVSGYPRTIPTATSVSPAVGDLDQNGLLDLTVAYGGSLALLDLNKTYSAASLQWPQAWVDARHNGVFQLAGLRGDLDGNGSVNVLDVQKLSNVILGTETAPAVVARGDLNNDGLCNTIDLQLLVNLVLRG